MNNQIITGIYRHFKGSLYEVLGVGYDATKSNPYDNKLVIYRSISTGELWTRPYNEFFEEVIVGDKSVPRFYKQGDDGDCLIYPVTNLL